jgi:hypothetical protein
MINYWVLGMYEITGELKDLELEIKLDEVIKRIKKSKDYKNAWKEWDLRAADLLRQRYRETIFTTFDWLGEDSGYNFRFMTEDEIKDDPKMLLHNIVLGAY